MRPKHPLTYKQPSVDDLKGTVSDSITHPEDVLEWRKFQFRSFGYAPYLADFLAESRIDLHAMEGLLNAGCPHELATAILMGTAWHGEDDRWNADATEPEEPEDDDTESDQTLSPAASS